MKKGKSLVRSYKAEQWYETLVEEVRAAIIETRYSVQEALIRGKHAIGEAIVAHEGKVSPTELVASLAGALETSVRTIEQCVQFYRADPELKVLEEGKNISWRKVLKQIQSERPREEECLHKGKPIIIHLCPHCGVKL